MKQTATEKKAGTGAGSYRVRRHGEILAALMTHRTIDAAAEAVGVSRMTIYRNLRDADFRAEYLSTIATIAEEARHQLRLNMSKAASVLAAAMDSEKESVRLRAAAIVLDAGKWATETVELTARLDRIESAISARGNGR